jgi:ketosteroid isomerase-like protein
MRFLPVALGIAAAACSPDGTARTTNADRADTVTTTASAGGVQAQEAAIREQETRWRNLISAHDTAAIKTFYTEDGIYSPQGRPAIRGREAITSRWAKEITSPGFRLERTPLRIEVASSGDIATETGTYRVWYTRDGKQRQETGTYMTAWRKDGGDWRITSYMWNRGAPER